jgi:hypothetical protein
MEVKVSNEMLVAEDKFESYRLGYKRGHDRGYGFREQQDRSEMLDMKATIVSRDEQIERYEDEIIARGIHVKQLKQEVETLKTAHGVTESLLKIAHNDINAFLNSEDYMKLEIEGLKHDLSLAKVWNTKHGLYGGVE